MVSEEFLHTGFTETKDFFVEYFLGFMHLCYNASDFDYPPLTAKVKFLKPTKMFFEALQVIVYILLPPGINFGISLKMSEITQMG